MYCISVSSCLFSIVPMHISGTHSHLPPSAWGFQPSDDDVVVRLGAPLASDVQDVSETMAAAKAAVSALGSEA